MGQNSFLTRLCWSTGCRTVQLYLPHWTVYLMLIKTGPGAVCTGAATESLNDAAANQKQRGFSTCVLMNVAPADQSEARHRSLFSLPVDSVGSVCLPTICIFIFKSLMFVRRLLNDISLLCSSLV